MAKGKGTDDRPDMEQMSLALPASTYNHSSDVAAVVQAVIGDFPEKFRHLVNAKIACLLRQSKTSEDAFSVDGSGGSFVRSDRERGISAMADIGVWFRAKWWQQFTPDARRAWVFHQLSHLAARPKGGGIVRVGHDAEVFAEEGLIFGAWYDQLGLFSQNLRTAAQQDGLRSTPRKPAITKAPEPPDVDLPPPTPIRTN